jgi:hypothetical protein
VTSYTTDLQQATGEDAKCGILLEEKKDLLALPVRGKLWNNVVFI